MPVKENHPTLFKKLVCFFEDPASACLFEAQFYQAQDVTRKRRGRREVRTLTVSADMPQKYTGFPGVQQVFRLTREVTYGKTKSVSYETVYGITSLAKAQASPERLLSLLQNHWTIENRSHYVRDVTFGEDVCRVRSGGAGQVLAALRNACISLIRSQIRSLIRSLIRLNGGSNIAAARRKYAAKPEQALKLIGCKITE